MHKENCDELEIKGEDTGIARYRRQLERMNRNKVIVFCGLHFGIFRNYEFAMLAGIRVRERTLMGESVQTVLTRYGVPIPDTS